MTPRSRILSTGAYLPSQVVGNDELAALVAEPAEQIARRTGIVQRHFARRGEAASDLALLASRRALQAAGRCAHDIDCVVFATHTPDYAFPGSGCVLAAKLGLVGVPALDVRNQCSGFLYGLSLADHFVRLGTYATVLVVAAEVMSAGMEFSPRGGRAATLFSDGAGAALVVAEPRPDRGILGAGLHADGRFARSLMVEAPGSSRHGPLRAADLEEGRHLPVVGGAEVFEEGLRRALESLSEALETCRLDAQDVKLFVPNHGLARLVPLLARRLGIPRERIYTDQGERGNPTGASIPIALDTVIRAPGLADGDTLVLFAFGSGFSWGWVVVRY
ncbi:beta-ketoacyl-ACP synthase 3 [Candidatus Binatia bacterium]|nr:beta-ketoacyl-ACP synthase 3 [Candidatus Binatia bacterium]